MRCRFLTPESHKNYPATCAKKNVKKVLNYVYVLTLLWSVGKYLLARNAFGNSQIFIAFILVQFKKSYR